jgi:hypothetical protein
MNFLKNKATDLIKLFNFDKLDDSKKYATKCCEQIIHVLNGIDCDENDLVMENINMEERFYNDVIEEIEKL